MIFVLLEIVAWANHFRIFSNNGLVPREELRLQKKFPLPIREQGQGLFLGKKLQFMFALDISNSWRLLKTEFRLRSKFHAETRQKAKSTIA